MLVAVVKAEHTTFMPIEIQPSFPRVAPDADVSPASKATRLNSRLKSLFAGLAVLVAGFAAGRQISSWPARLSYPGELDSVEGIVLADMVALRQGRAIYAPATPEQYNSAEYGPLYYLLGSSVTAPHKPSYLPIRLVAMLGTLGLAAGCGLLGFWLSGSYLAAALAPLLFLGYPLTTAYGVAVHPDSVAFLLWFGGFLIASRFRHSNKVLLAAPLMILGVFYKGQFVAALLAVLCWLGLKRRFRLAAAFAIVVAAGTLLLFAIFQFVIFRQQALWLHAVAYNAIPFHWRRLGGYLVAIGVIFGIPILIALWYLRSNRDRLLGCYLGWALLLPAVTIAKVGSGPNYYLELILILQVVFAVVIAENIHLPRRAVLLIALLELTLWFGHFFRLPNKPRPVDFAEDHAVQAYLRGHFAPRATSLGIFTGDLLRAGLDTPIANLYQYSWLVCIGRLPEASFVAQIEQRRFRVILLNQNFLGSTDPYKIDYMCATERVRQAVIHNYRLDATFRFHRFDRRRYYAWVPR